CGRKSGFSSICISSPRRRSARRRSMSRWPKRRSRAAAEQATRRLAFLAQASVALAGSLDLAAITRELAGLCVPFLADVCALALAAEDGKSASTEVAWMSDDPQLGLIRRSVDSVGHRWFGDAVERVRKSGKLETFGECPADAATGGPDEPLLARD